MATLRFAAGALLAGVGLTLWGCGGSGRPSDYPWSYRTECPKEGQENCTVGLRCYHEQDLPLSDHISDFCAGSTWMPNATCQKFDDFLKRADGKDNMECFNTAMCCFANMDHSSLTGPGGPIHCVEQLDACVYSATPPPLDDWNYLLYQTECPKEGQEGCTFSLACDTYDQMPRHEFSSTCLRGGEISLGPWDLTCQEFNDFLKRADGQDNMKCWKTSMCCFANTGFVDWPGRDACREQLAACGYGATPPTPLALDHYNKKMDYSKEVNVTSLALDHFNKKMDYNKEVTV